MSLARSFIGRSRKSIAPFARAASTFKLPDMPYDFGALEPVISGEIMKIHYEKHHAAYVNNLNIALEKLADAESKNDVTGVIQQQAAIKFNGGGHINHSIFWNNLAPTSCGGGEPPGGALGDVINAQFGSLEGLQTKMSAAAVAVQGSGWAWLGYDKAAKSLRVATCANQDPLEATTGLVPLLGIDVWEHAYYLQYKNVRPDYVKNVWKVVSWRDVTSRFEKAK